MQAKPRHLGRSVKPVVFLALTMVIALISALLIIHSLVQATEPDQLSSVSSRQTETVLLLAHEGGLIDHCSRATQKPLPEPDASLLHSESH